VEVEELRSRLSIKSGCGKLRFSLGRSHVWKERSVLTSFFFLPEVCDFDSRALPSRGLLPSVRSFLVTFVVGPGEVSLGLDCFANLSLILSDSPVGTVALRGPCGVDLLVLRSSRSLLSLPFFPAVLFVGTGEASSESSSGWRRFVGIERRKTICSTS